MKKYIMTGFVLAFLFVLTTQAAAQFIYFPYYGKNKVIYKNFQWEKYSTEHFDIYFYTKDTDMLQKIASYAESAYHTLSQNVKHHLSAKVPILYYRTVTDFQQTNLFNIPSDSILGVAEPLLYRVAVHGDMPEDELQNLVEHELTHIFEYDLLWGSPGGAVYAVSSPPLWVMEGFSEYNTGEWSSWSELIVRDTVLNDRIPEMSQRGSLVSRYPAPRPPAYDFGHAIYEFIEHKYGKNGIKELWETLKNAPTFGISNPIKQAFDVDTKEFNHEFKKYIRDRFKPFLLRDNPEDYSFIIGPEYPMNEYYFTFSHTLSPSGDLVAAVTFNVRDGEMDIVLISMEDGEIWKNLTKGYTLKYSDIKYEIESSLGRDVAWSSDGDLIAFFGRTGEKHSLFLLDVLNGGIVKKIPIPYDQPTSPWFTDQNQNMIFTAFDKGYHDIFKINLETEETQNLTQNDLFEKAPHVSPDGRWIAYTIRINTEDKIFLSPADNLKEKKQITFGKGNTITPHFSQDSRLLYYSGDSRDAFNVYSVNLENGEILRYTDVRTGNFFPVPVPNDDDHTILFSSFNKGAFQIFRSSLEGKKEKAVTFVENVQEDDFQLFQPIVSVDIDEKKIEPYKGIKELYLEGKPPVDTIVSTDGSIYGGSAISFSDLFRDHTFTLMAYQVQSFRSYYFSYLNQKKRLQYQASAFQYTMYYYPSFAYYNPSLFYRLNYRDALATRKISGASVAAYYPFNLYYRLQGSMGFYRYEEEFYNAFLIRQASTQANSVYDYFWNGNSVQLSATLVGETTKFKYYGPSKGGTFRLGITQAVPLGDSFISNTNADLDYRKYFYIGADSLFAFRFNGFASWGENPYLNYYGGNNQVRSAYYYSLIGTEGWFSNLEFRFPLINAASTLIGQIGPVRGTLFFDITRKKLKGFPAEISIMDDDGIVRDYEAIGSFGYGFEFFFLGFPIHLEFVKGLAWSDFSDPFDYNVRTDWMTKFWIGFDF
jgi:Tol biopolymer transport system component